MNEFAFVFELKILTTSAVATATARHHTKARNVVDILKQILLTGTPAAVTAPSTATSLATATKFITTNKQQQQAAASITTPPTLAGILLKRLTLPVAFSWLQNCTHSLAEATSSYHLSWRLECSCGGLSDTLEQSFR